MKRGSTPRSQECRVFRYRSKGDCAQTRPFGSIEQVDDYVRLIQDLASKYQISDVEKMGVLMVEKARASTCLVPTQYPSKLLPIRNV